MTAHTSFIHKSDIDEFKGITCTKCGEPVLNYDPGSAAYQEYYGHPLPAICDDCLGHIFERVRRYNRRG